ncbi:MAG: NAD(P)-dependent oxidoreductase [Candidatus Thorarchaeota archaeon]
MPPSGEPKVNVYFIDEIPVSVQNYLKEKLKDLRNLELIFSKNQDKDSNLEDIANANILIGWRPSLALLEKATKMSLFINPGAGIRHLLNIFNEINKKKSVTLINGHGNSYFVAQHAVALLLTLTNKIIQHHEWMRQGKWRTGDEEAASIPLRFRKVGLFGYGAINQKVHQMLQGFGCDFSILRKHWEKQTNDLITPAKRYEFAELHKFLKEINILIIATPSTSLTERIIKQKELDLLGNDGLIVNVARGEIIDEQSLYLSLKDRKIAGAAIDVWYNYSPKSNEDGTSYPFKFPFHMLENIVLSPHRGYSPFNDFIRWNEVIENITRFSHNRSDFINVVNLEDEY